VNKWWISDDTRYSYKVLQDPNRLKESRKLQYGAPAEVTYGKAMEEAVAGLKAVVSTNGTGTLFAVLSPMMACEEAFLLGQLIRSIDPRAVLIAGPAAKAESDEVFKHFESGKETFRIQAEKVPNAAGIKRVMDLLGGPQARFDELAAGGEAIKKLKGGWIVGGYLSKWLPATLPAALRSGFRVIQDILPNAITDNADVVLPAAAWAEKDGCWENYAGKIQAFAAAVAPPEGARREGDVYYKLLGRTGMYNADEVRAEMGPDFANVKLPTEAQEAPAFEFAEL
jgi:NADH-quinone oxidoreductase subunit G